VRLVHDKQGGACGPLPVSSQTAQVTFGGRDDGELSLNAFLGAVVKTDDLAAEDSACFVIELSDQLSCRGGKYQPLALVEVTTSPYVGDDGLSGARTAYYHTVIFGIVVSLEAALKRIQHIEILAGKVPKGQTGKIAGDLVDLPLRISLSAKELPDEGSYQDRSLLVRQVT